MLKINGLELDVEPLQLLNDLKLSLEQNGINLLHTIKPAINNIQVSCPYHKEGQEKKPSCGISTTDTYKEGRLIPTGTVHCFTCGKTVLLNEMISHCFGYEDGGRFGNKWLKANYNSTLVASNRKFELDINRRRSKKEYITISDELLEKYRYYHDYMFTRGLDENIIELFDIGYDSDNHAITFPVKDISGNVKFLQSRYINKKIYHIPEGITKTDFIFGGYECMKYNTEKSPVYICESIFNCLTLWKLGKFAVALLGTGGGQQYESLKRLPFRHYVIALDNDDAGNEGARKLYDKLNKSKLLSLVVYQDTRDINDLQEEFLNVKIRPLNY